MSKEVLSICIPTYNRYPYLKRLLDILLPEVKALNGIVEIYITDNASTDETQALCQKYIEDGFPLNYDRNSENKGPDFNITKAFGLGAGNFVWVLGDDEVVYRGALERLVAYLVEAMDVGLVFMPPMPFREENVRSVDFEHLDVALYKDRAAYAKRVGVLFTFISSIIVNRKVVLNAGPSFDPKKFFDTKVVQLSWVLLALAKAEKFAVVKNNLFAAEENNSGGYGIFTVFGEGLAAVSSSVLVEHPSVKDAILDSAAFFLLSWRFVARGKFEAENPLIPMDRAFMGRPKYRYFVRWFFVLPDYLAASAYFCFRSVRWIYNRSIGRIL